MPFFNAFCSTVYNVAKTEKTETGENAIGNCMTKTNSICG